ncbi:putative nicotinate-nucleotide adenylyltransferase [Aureimonas glaciei]|uniref:Probable nicotinate-nucleotide adenylyltransferase n=1 Tax=Aureimonas glaciei TaxID=1776957 RepID=A0A917DJL4_9HYPH|nr:putative nicotinate-nucleotide adenylyltransferase [Aureimonas glaciei]
MTLPRPQDRRGGGTTALLDVAAADLRLPHTESGMTVGLFGGSFDPPHAGHLLVAETALRRLQLDRLWWIVTPGNPLKRHERTHSLGERIAASRHIAAEPRIDVTAFEAAHRLRYTADTLALVRQRRPDVHFVWVMGADSLASFHRWQDWRGIVGTMPIAVVDRPGATLSILSSPMAKTFSRFRLSEADGAALPFRKAPAWVFLHGPRSPLSSTALRSGEASGGARS